MAKMRKTHQKNGFTLVEVIIVLVIIAIAAAIAAPSITKFMDSANRRNCQITTADMVHEIQTALTKTRITPGETDIYSNANKTISDVVERYAGKEVSINKGSNIYYIQTDGICDAKGIHVLNWIFTSGKVEDGKTVTADVALDCGCDLHGAVESMTCEIVFRYAYTPVPPAQIIDFLTAEKLVNAMTDMAQSNRTNTDIYNDFTDYLKNDPLMSQYITQSDIDYFTANFDNSVTWQNIIELFANDYMFNTIWKPTMVIEGTEQVIYRRLKSPATDADENIYIVKRQEGNEDQAIYLLYRRILANEYAWFKYTKGGSGFFNLNSIKTYTQTQVDAYIILASVANDVEEVLSFDRS